MKLGPGPGPEGLRGRVSEQVGQQGEDGGVGWSRAPRGPGSREEDVQCYCDPDCSV